MVTERTWLDHFLIIFTTTESCVEKQQWSTPLDIGISFLICLMMQTAIIMQIPLSMYRTCPVIPVIVELIGSCWETVSFFIWNVLQQYILWKIQYRNFFSEKIMFYGRSLQKHFDRYLHEASLATQLVPLNSKKYKKISGQIDQLYEQKTN